MSSRYTTHVANAYSRTIEVRVRDNRVNLTSAGGGANYGGAGATGNATWEYDQQKQGFTPIAPGDFLGFPVSGSDGYVYVSVKNTPNPTDNFQVKNDCSMIVDANGNLKHTKYGKIWVDTSGRKHL